VKSSAIYKSLANVNASAHNEYAKRHLTHCAVEAIKRGEYTLSPHPSKEIHLTSAEPLSITWHPETLEPTLTLETTWEGYWWVSDTMRAIGAVVTTLNVTMHSLSDCSPIEDVSQRTYIVGRYDSIAMSGEIRSNFMDRVYRGASKAPSGESFQRSQCSKNEPRIGESILTFKPMEIEIS
jgi:hypothetical protein